MPDEMMPSALPGLLTRHIGSEAVVLDISSGAATHLNETAARVFTVCDGTSDRRALEAELGADRVAETLILLGDADLIQPPAVSRRQLLTRGSLAAGLLMAAPIVASIALPAAAAASSADPATVGQASGASVLQPADVAGSLTPAPVQVEGTSLNRVAADTQEQKDGSAKTASADAGSATAGSALATAPLAFTGANTVAYLETAAALISAGAAAIGAATVMDRRSQT